MREISVRIFDDLDFTREGLRNEAVVTLTVGLDGFWRELDLTEANEKMVRDTLDKLMCAGREPKESPLTPAKARGKGPGPNPEKAAFNERLRAWCRQNGVRNASGTGWAYQTNKSGQDYIGEPLIRKYRAYLDEQAGAGPQDSGK